MTRAMPSILAAALAILSGGCGTCLSYRDRDSTPIVPYSGIKRNWNIIEYNTDSSHGRMFPIITVLIGAIDLPFSLIADTLVLPWTLPETNYMHNGCPSP